MNFSWILDSLAVGSCPITTRDVDVLIADGIRSVMSLQTKEDQAYWNVDWASLKRYYASHSLHLCHAPVPDFQPDVLGASLPGLVHKLDALIKHHAPVYLHCNVGVNRSPTTAIAWLHLVEGWPLYKAANLLAEKRPVCMPYAEVIPANE